MSQHLDSKKRGKSELPASGALPVVPYDVAAASTPGVRGVNEDSYFVAALKPAITLRVASECGVKSLGRRLRWS